MVSAPCIGIVFVDNYSWVARIGIILSCNQKEFFLNSLIFQHLDNNPIFIWWRGVGGQSNKILTLAPLSPPPHVQLMGIFTLGSKCYVWREMGIVDCQYMALKGHFEFKIKWVKNVIITNVQISIHNWWVWWQIMKVTNAYCGMQSKDAAQ